MPFVCGLVGGKSHFQRHQIPVWTSYGQLSYRHGILTAQPEPSHFQFVQLASVSSRHKSRPRYASVPHADYALSTCKRFDAHSMQLDMSFMRFAAFFALASLAKGTFYLSLRWHQINDYLYSCTRPPCHLL